MPTELPPGAQIPKLFNGGEILTDEALNELQRALLSLILSHTHSGNDQGAPQGALIGPDGIADRAVQSRHLSNINLVRGQIAPGAIGPLELGERVVATNHLAEGAIQTRHLADQQVNLAKLAADVLAEIRKPHGPTTEAYCLYLEGANSYQPQSGSWYEFVLKPAFAYLSPIHLVEWQDDQGAFHGMKKALDVSLTSTPPTPPVGPPVPPSGPPTPPGGAPVAPAGPPKAPPAPTDPRPVPLKEPTPPTMAVPVLPVRPVGPPAAPPRFTEVAPTAPAPLRAAPAQPVRPQYVWGFTKYELTAILNAIEADPWGYDHSWMP